MLKDLNLKNTEEISSWFKSRIDNGEMGDKIQLARLFGMAQSKEEEDEQIEEIREKHNLNDHCDIIIVSEDIIIVKQFEKLKQKYAYHSIVNGIKNFEGAYNFDYALLIALSYKYGAGDYAPKAIYHMLNMDKYEEQKKEESVTV